jgi:hypothetical protein
MRSRLELGGRLRRLDAMGYNQVAYDTECAALARALETAARRQTTPERVTDFTDAQAGIRRIASEDPGPSQMHAI